MNIDELAALSRKTDEPATDANKTEETPDVETLTKENVKLKEQNKALQDGNSALGRKVKMVEQDANYKYAALQKKIEEMSQVENRNKPSDKSNDRKDDLDFDDMELEDLSAKDIKKLLKAQRKIAREEAEAASDRRYEEKENKKSAARTKYINDYDQTIYALGSKEEPKIYEQVLQRLQSMGGYSDNGVDDATKNYYLALTEVLRNGSNTNTTTNNNAFRQDDPSGTQLGGGSYRKSKDLSEASYERLQKDPNAMGYANYIAGKRGIDPDKFLKNVAKYSAAKHERV